MKLRVLCSSFRIDRLTLKETEVWSAASRVWLVLAVGASLGMKAYCATKPTDIAGLLLSNGFHRIPFVVREHNKLVTKIDLNGKKRKWLLDTGWTISTITTRNAVKFGLTPIPGDYVDPLLGRWYSTNAGVFLNQIRFGEWTSDRIPVRLMDQPGAVVTREADGVLGLDFFVRNCAFISCVNGEFFLRRDPLTRADRGTLQLKIEALGYRPVPMRKGGGGETVAADIEGHPARMLVDTGGENSVLDDSFAMRHGLKNRVTPGSMTGVEGRVARMYTSKVGTFRIGPVQEEDVRINVVDLHSWGLGDGVPRDQIDGILGFDTLKRWSALIDIQGSQLYLLKVKSR